MTPEPCDRVPCKTCGGLGYTGDRYMVTDAWGEAREEDERVRCEPCEGAGYVAARTPEAYVVLDDRTNAFEAFGPFVSAQPLAPDLCAPIHGSCLVFELTPFSPTASGAEKDAALDAYLGEFNAYRDALDAAGTCAEPTAKGCHGCANRAGRSIACWLIGVDDVTDWQNDHLSDDLLTPKPNAPECPGRVAR